MLLNNPIQPAPAHTSSTKALINQDTHKPTGGVFGRRGRPKRVATEKKYFSQKRKTPSTKGEVD